MTTDPLSSAALKYLSDWAELVLETSKRIGLHGVPSQRFAESILALLAEREHQYRTYTKAADMIAECDALKAEVAKLVAIQRIDGDDITELLAERDALLALQAAVDAYAESPADDEGAKYRARMAVWSANNKWKTSKR